MSLRPIDLVLKRCAQTIALMIDISDFIILIMYFATGQKVWLESNNRWFIWLVWYMNGGSEALTYIDYF